MFMSSCLVATAADQQVATKEEAVAMVKKAVAYIRQNGKDKALAEFSRPQGQFVDRELYIAVLDLNGMMLAHGANPKLIGKSLLDIKDVNGKAFVREQIEIARNKDSGWVEFEWFNPVSQKMGHRYTYLERVDDYFVLSGVYKK
jgi:signal transduction histidine kinase